jgi:hypothetical protein
MQIVAFDSGDFSRRKKVDGEREIVFFTPLGIGVSIDGKLEEEFKAAYLNVCKKLGMEFKVPTKRVVYSHASLWKEIGHRKAIPFCDNVIKELQKFIDLVFVSYVVLPSDEVQSVNVGGYGCPIEAIPTMSFLRNLSPMFSYITAWSYTGRHVKENHVYLIHNFSSKLTMAWQDLIDHTWPKIFPRGDECNPFISVADMFAYLTEKKLWDAKLWLDPRNIMRVWADYDFEVEVRFLDKNVLSKYRWFSQEPIDVANYLARPMVFLDIEGISISKVAGDPYVSVAAYAFWKGGGFQGFDEGIDAGKIRDGDVYVYAGEKAKVRAFTFKDMYDIEVYSVRELRRKVQELFV